MARIPLNARFVVSCYEGKPVGNYANQVVRTNKPTKVYTDNNKPYILVIYVDVWLQSLSQSEVYVRADNTGMYMMVTYQQLLEWRLKGVFAPKLLLKRDIGKNIDEI